MNKNEVVENLEFIKKVIQESRQSIIYGTSFIVWGALVSLSLVITYLLILTENYSSIQYIWIGLMIIGWGYSVYEKRKLQTETKPKTFVENITSSVWFATGISITTIAILGMTGKTFNPGYISPIISMILGVAYYVTASLHNYKWLKNISFGWWIGAICLFFITSSFSLIIMAILMICFQVIPGLILLNKNKKNND